MPFAEASAMRSGVLALCLSAALPAFSQPVPRAPVQSSFLFVNQERLLTASRTGRALLDAEEAATQALREEARAIDAAFEARERELAQKRAELAPEDFRLLADAFDAEVVEARRLQDERSAALAQELDQRRRQFFGQIAPLLVAVMERHGAKAIFDENSILLSDQTINITDDVILAIDANLASEVRDNEPGTPSDVDDTGGGQQ